MKKSIYVIAHNIRSAYNVGSIFRTADAVGVEKIILGGYSPSPPHSGISKTALGAEKWMPFEKSVQTWRKVNQLKKKGFQIVALEQSTKSIDYREFKPKFPLALILGNEVRGLSTQILNRCDAIIEIPMVGQKESLNVSVAFGIAIYQLKFCARSDLAQKQG